MNKIKVVYLNTPVTWRELLDWDEETDMGPIYHMQKASNPTDLHRGIVSIYGWSEDDEVVERFLEERNRELFVVRILKLNDKEYKSFREDYAHFMLRVYEMPTECEQGAIDVSNLDIDTIKLVATRAESAFLTDSTDTIQFLESFLTKTANYAAEIFTNKICSSLGVLSYFNYAVRNSIGMYQVEIFTDPKISQDEQAEQSIELMDEGVTASENRYSIIDGTPTAFGDTTDVKINYMRLFKFAFWFTYIDTVPDYSSVYH